MDEPVRLVCPSCNLVYRVKKLKLGKAYNCRSCGGALRTLDPVRLNCPSCGAVTEESNLDVSRAPHCQLCEGAPPLILPSDYEAGIADANLDASVSAQTAIPARSGGGGTAVRRAVPAAVGGDLARLPRMIENLTAALEEFKLAELREAGARSENENRILGAAEELTTGLKALNDKLTGDFQHLDARIAELLGKLESDNLDALSQQLRETGGLFMDRLQEYREAQSREIAGLLAAATANANAPAAHGQPHAADPHAVELDIDDLASRLASGIQMHAPRLDGESGAAVDALARVADELVKEQGANTSRLDHLAEEIRDAVVHIQRLDEWRVGLPSRVADEIGRTVEDRVVGPLSGALARQAPAILSDLQDNKLVDIVSRSVREAQRPLLREILTGGRNKVPAWLFLIVFCLFLFTLGYLFLPGELGFGNNAERLAAVADGMERIEQTGLPLSHETLADIEQAIANAVGDVRNDAALKAQVDHLRLELERVNQLQKEYETVVAGQTRRIRSYENRLVRLGVSPDTITD